MYNYSYLSMKKQIMNKIFTKLTIYKNYYTALINSDLYQMIQIKIGSSFLNYQVECFASNVGETRYSPREETHHTSFALGLTGSGPSGSLCCPLVRTE